MKAFLLAFVVFGSVFVSAEEVKTVDYVDLTRYQGTWYEIAKYPQWFEKGMTHVKATYALKDNNSITVLNEGLKGERHKKIKGSGTVVKNSGNAKLRVCFFWPFYGDYWIIDLADNYSWAVVSNSNRSTLWILSRTPVMDGSVYASIIKRLVSNGFDLEKLEKTKQ